MGAAPRSVHLCCERRPAGFRPASVGALLAPLVGAASRACVARRILRFQPPSFVFYEAYRPFRHISTVVRLRSKFKRETSAATATNRPTERTAPGVSRRTAAKPCRRQSVRCPHRRVRAVATIGRRPRCLSGRRSPAPTTCRRARRAVRCCRRRRPRRNRRVPPVDNARATRCKLSSDRLCARQRPTSSHEPHCPCRGRRKYISCARAHPAAASVRVGRAATSSVRKICSTDSRGCSEARNAASH